MLLIDLIGKLARAILYTSKLDRPLFGRLYPRVVDLCVGGLNNWEGVSPLNFANGVEHNNSLASKYDKK